MVREAICGEKPPALSLEAPLPGRPPVLCPGCPHRSLFYALKQLDVFVSGDIGCYTLGALPPLEMLDTCLCMGASVSALHGRNKVRGTGAAPAVAVIGDSTFLHSGVTGLMNAAYNQSASVVIILDNSITGMTGHQQNPATGQTLKGDATAAVDLEALCRAVGIRHVGVVDPYDIRASRDAVKAALAAGEAAAVISRRPCALLKTVRRKPPLRVDAAKCVDCKRCMGLGCPALRRQDGKVSIDEDQCVGCGVCAQLCAPRAIGGETV
jgi:indolepyruvate ferredoxin oxidoreductase alpha subunit